MKVVLFRFPFVNAPLVVSFNEDTNTEDDYLRYFFNRITEENLWPSFRYKHVEYGRHTERSFTNNFEIRESFDRVMSEQENTVLVSLFMLKVIAFYRNLGMDLLEIYEMVHLTK